MTSIHHNAENRPVRWTNAETGTVITMTFDSQGRRTEYKSVTNGVQNTWLRFLYDGYLCIQVLYSNAPYNVFKEFVWDPTEPVATRPLVFRYAPNSLNLFYAFDGNKNVSDVFYRLTSNGIGAHYDYAPFGAVTRTHSDSSASFDIVSLNPFRFSSEYYDSELDLVYYNYRHYSPLLGRFLSRDPIAEQGGLNLYAFVGNDPNDFIDIKGEFSVLTINGPDFDVSPDALCCLEEKPLWKAEGYSSLSECMGKKSTFGGYFSFTCSTLCALKSKEMGIASGFLGIGFLLGDTLGSHFTCGVKVCTRMKPPIRNIRWVQRPSGRFGFEYWSCPDKTLSK